MQYNTRCYGKHSKCTLAEHFAKLIWAWFCCNNCGVTFCIIRGYLIIGIYYISTYYTMYSSFAVLRKIHILFWWKYSILICTVSYGIFEDLQNNKCLQVDYALFSCIRCFRQVRDGTSLEQYCREYILYYSIQVEYNSCKSDAGILSCNIANITALTKALEYNAQIVTTV